MRTKNVLTAIVAVIAMLAFSATALAATTISGPGAHQAKAKHKARKKGAKKKGAKKKKGKKKAAAIVPSLTVTGGTVTITPSAASSADFTQHKVTTTASAPATLAGEVVTLPIASGTLNPVTGYGSLTLSGGYAYSETSSLNFGLGSFTSGTEAGLSDLTISLAASSQLSASVGNPPTNGAFFALKGLKPAKSAGTLTLAGIEADLTAAAASLLTQFGGTFTANGSFGTISIQATV